jgi:cytochrome c556
MKSTRKAAWLAAGVTLSLAIASVASAAGNPVADRQAAMKLIAQSMKEASGFASGQKPFDAALVKSTLGQVSAATVKLHKLFPATSAADPKSASDPKVWASKADFDKRLTDMGSLAATAGKATSPETLKPALGALGASCKSCHDIYRMKKPA